MSDTAVQTHSMAYDWFWLWIPSSMKPLWMEISFYSPFYCDYSWIYDAECAEVFGITAFIWKPFEHTCFFCSCTTSSCTFQNFHIVGISKQFIVILKTLLEITWELAVHYQLWISCWGLVTWTHTISSIHWKCNYWGAKKNPKPRTYILLIPLKRVRWYCWGMHPRQ